jgi:hypothetical protein
MRRAVSGDTGGLPLAMLLILVVASLSAATIPVVLVQSRETGATTGRSHAYHAAQTGLEVAVAQLRAAYAGSGVGDRRLLPCGPLDGSAGTDAAATYSVQIGYFDDDPSLPGAATMTCAQAQTGAAAPRFARLTATGTTDSGRSSRRALRGDYPLLVAAAPTPASTWGPEEDNRVQPRPILAYSPSVDNIHICLDAGSGQPAAGTPVRLQRCDADAHEDNGYKQNWYYRTDLSVATVGSILGDKPMCLDAGAAAVAGLKLVVQPCVSPVPVRQRWYYNAYRNFELAASTGPGQDDVALSGLCLNVATPETAGSDLVLGAAGNCRSSTFSTRQTFSMYTKVGPGQAGSRSLDCAKKDVKGPCVLTQLRNQGMPSRCLDLYSTFIANIECVQDPDPAKIRWNQLWRMPKAADGPAGATGPIFTVDPSGATLCLTVSASMLPTQQACTPKKPTSDQVFTVYRDTGNQFTMYRIVDSLNRCLTHANADTDGGDYTFYWNYAAYHWKTVMDRCVNSDQDPYATDQWNEASVLLRQKWNGPFQLPGDPKPTPSTPAPSASPDPASAVPLRNLLEVPPTG